MKFQEITETSEVSRKAKKEVRNKSSTSFILKTNYENRKYVSPKRIPLTFKSWSLLNHIPLPSARDKMYWKFVERYTSYIKNLEDSNLINCIFRYEKNFHSDYFWFKTHNRFTFGFASFNDFLESAFSKECFILFMEI